MVRPIVLAFYGDVPRPAWCPRHQSVQIPKPVDDRSPVASAHRTSMLDADAVVRNTSVEGHLFNSGWSSETPATRVSAT